jgi:hypothetical protein
MTSKRRFRLRTAPTPSPRSIETRSINSRSPRTTAPQSMPTAPSSLAGFTINGNSRSSMWSSFPQKLLAKRGVRMEWKSKIFFASALQAFERLLT